MGEEKTASSGRFVLPAALGALPTGAAKVTVDLLGRRIANDVYLPGQIMPTEAELAESLSVSRATIRDAVKVLSGKGLVRTARRYGTRVRPVEEWNLLDADVVSWHEHKHPRLMLMFSETTELRSLIEPGAAALAAERATPEQAATIMSAAQALNPDQTDLAMLFDADCRFHATILEATGNLMMVQLRPLILTMLRISYDYGVIGAGGDLSATRQGHVDVAEAICAKNPEAARRSMQAMLDGNRRVAEATQA